MQSNNPVFRNSDEFNGRATNAYGNQVYDGSGAPHQGYGRRRPPTRPPGAPAAPTHTGADAGRMTIDSVVQKTGLSLFIVVVVAFVTWVMTPALPDSGSDLSRTAMSTLYRLR